MHKISVVVPCYNAEKYIERCLESLLAQTYPELEIILVNDGSTDHTKEIVTPFLEHDCIRYIEQKNAGESAARNAGIAVATGEYIGFVDADDYVLPQMYEKLYSAITETEADMAACNFNLVYDDQSADDKKMYAYMPSGLIDIKEDVYRYWTSVCAAPRPNNYVWTRLYRRDILLKTGVRFEKYLHSADTLFNFKLLPYLKKAVFVPEGLYNYVQREGSGIHTIAKKGNIASLYADTFQALADYYKENKFDAFLSILPIHAYTRMRSIFFYSRLAGQTDEEIISTILSGWKNRDIFKYFTGDIT